MENFFLRHLRAIKNKALRKSDRVIGNRDLIANPFFQGYSRSDFDLILDHFLAKGLGFDCQSQKKGSVTTMKIGCSLLLSQM